MPSGPGFYLHNLSSLDDAGGTERKKFHTVSKTMIRRVSPETLSIPETDAERLGILAKMAACSTLGDRSEDGWDVAFSNGFHRANDAHLLRDDRRGWPVLEGKNIHQFNHAFAGTEFTATKSAGLQREGRKRVFGGDARRFYHSFRPGFRNISASTNMRTIIASIIPPQRFHTHSVNSIVLTRNGGLERGNEYNRKTAHLCGILNSMPFDFAARSKMQMNVAPILKMVPVPEKRNYDEIAELATRLAVGADEFEGLAESLRVENVAPAPPERIRMTAKLDALVAHAYGLSNEEYVTVLDSFKFTENPDLLEAESADFNDNKVLRQFYGEVRKLAPRYFDEIAGGKA